MQEELRGEQEYKGQIQEVKLRHWVYGDQMKDELTGL